MLFLCVDVYLLVLCRNTIIDKGMLRIGSTKDGPRLAISDFL